MSEWIEWEGGKRPVLPEALVEVKIRSGLTAKENAYKFDWAHYTTSGDIVAYRLADCAMPNEGSKVDMVNSPAHYTAGKVECIDALEAATVNLSGIEAVCTANAIKYLWRWKQKGGKQDLEKAQWYIKHLLERTE